MNAPDQMALSRAAHVPRGAQDAVAAASAPRQAIPAAVADRTEVGYSFEREGRRDLILLASVRAALAFAGVFILWFTPQESHRLVVLTCSALIVYAVYSAGVVWIVSRFHTEIPHRALAWFDVVFSGCLVALSGGTSTIFFFYFLLAILTAAFTRGFLVGMEITIASAVAFAVAGLTAGAAPLGGEIDRTLVRPLYLFAIGFLLSHWGGSVLQLKRRLALLYEIGRMASVRQNPDATIAAVLRRLCSFFRADRVVLALAQADVPGSGKLYVALSSDADASCTPMQAGRETIKLFMAIPERASAWPHRRLPERYLPLDTPSRLLEMRTSEPVMKSLANLLEAKNLTSAGYRQGSAIGGRLVLARDRRRFGFTDATFLMQCAQTLAAAVENITLTDELVTRAAEFERLNISRDLHDSTIQPYIGLRMAIEGVAREFRSNPIVAERLSQLIDITDVGIEELRDYTRRLKSGKDAGVSSLATAIERHADRLSRFYGLAVEVQVEPSLKVPAQTAEIIFRLVSEGLSNVLRHTAAKIARVVIRSAGIWCTVEIANPLANDAPPPQPFVPASIAERAAGLGGRILVEAARKGHTTVTVWLPRHAMTS